jgi:hypothetical protein
MYAGQRVIVYGLRGEDAQHNRRHAVVQNYDPRLNRFRVKLLDAPASSSLVLDGGNLFFPSMHLQYFSTPFTELPLLTEATRVRYAGFRPTLVATERIRAGTVHGIPSVRFALTDREIDDLEREFTAAMTAHMAAALGRTSKDPRPPTVQLERQYNAVMPFVGVLARDEVWFSPMLRTLNDYDPTSRECLRELWPRTNGVNLLWFAFWCAKLPHLTPRRVWHAWHFALTFAWPSANRRIVVVSQLIGSMHNPPERLREFQKVADGLQDAAVDNLACKTSSDLVLSLPESEPYMKAFFINTVQPGDAIRLDAGTDCSNPCDTVLNCLFMDQFNGFFWIKLYKLAANLLGKPPVVARSLENFINDNVDRVKAMTGGAVLPARTTPAVFMPPGALPAALPRCALCAQPMHAKFVCDRCKNVAYCSKACQIEAWKTHKSQCAEIVD